MKINKTVKPQTSAHDAGIVEAQKSIDYQQRMIDATVAYKDECGLRAQARADFYRSLAALCDAYTPISESADKLKDFVTQCRIAADAEIEAQGAKNVVTDLELELAEMNTAGMRRALEEHMKQFGIKQK